jgi:hypothetical protein
MKNLIGVLFLIFLLIGCKKKTCIEEKIESSSIKPRVYTDGKVKYWAFDHGIARDAPLYYLTENCDTVCVICFCTPNCKIEISNLTEIK